MARDLMKFQRDVLLDFTQQRGLANVVQVEGWMREAWSVESMSAWLTEWLKGHYGEIGGKVGAGVAKWAKKVAKKEGLEDDGIRKSDIIRHKSWRPPAEVEAFAKKLADALRVAAEERSLLMVGIAEEVQGKIIDVVRSMYAGGESIPEIQKEIAKIIPSPTKVDKLFGIIGRAERIARTEAANAANTATHEAVVKMDMKGTKVWNAELDPTRTRESHLDMHGQRVAINEPFRSLMTGDEVMFPCDTSLGASAAFIINCRCVAEYDLQL